MKPLRMAAYCRVSTQKEAQLDSLAHQEEFFASYARRGQLVLTRIYADAGISGRQMKHRTEFLTMLRDAQARAFDVLCVKDISRFARNTVDCLQAVRLLKKYGIQIRFLSEGQECIGNSEFILTVYASLAQEESAHLSKRIQFGKDINAKKGRVPPVIFGYTRTGLFSLRRLPREADIVREIFRLYLTGMGTTGIAARLNQAGKTTKRGNAWNARGVRRCLDNPIYCGILVNHKSTVIDYLEGTVRALPREDWYVHARPEWAIVSPETFEAAQCERERRRAIAERGKACGINRNIRPTGAVGEDHGAGVPLRLLL